MDRLGIENYLTIQDVSIQLHVPKSTLRYWEQAFGSLIEPIRTKGGQRRYGQEQIDLFRQVVELKQSGKKIAQIKHILGKKNDTHPGRNIDSDGSVDVLAQRIARLVDAEVRKFFANSRIGTL